MLQVCQLKGPARRSQRTLLRRADASSSEEVSPSQTELRTFNQQRVILNGSEFEIVIDISPLSGQKAPEPGAIVHVRQRLYLVEQVQPPPNPGDATLVSLSCVDDDAQGQPLDVLWEVALRKLGG